MIFTSRMKPQIDLLVLVPISCHEYIKDHYLFGSQAVGGGAVHAESDIDIFVLTEHPNELKQKLMEEGFSDEGSKVDFTFTSLRKGEVNVVVTENSEVFLRNKKATQLCVTLQLNGKDDRIMVHEFMSTKFGFDDSNLPNPLNNWKQLDPVVGAEPPPWYKIYE